MFRSKFICIFCYYYKNSFNLKKFLLISSIFKYLNEKFVFEAWLLSQNQQVRNDFAGYRRCKRLANHIKPIKSKHILRSQPDNEIWSFNKTWCEKHFFEKEYAKCGKKASLRPPYTNQNWEFLWINRLKSCFYCMLNWRSTKIY